MEIYRDYRHAADFYVIYILEAHPIDGWALDVNREQHVEFAQPTTFREREEVASACAVGLKLTVPAVVDDMENRAATLFNAWPERLYVLSTDGRVEYKGGKGPYGFDPEELAEFLRNLLPA